MRTAKLDVYFLTYPEPSMRSNTKDSFINLKKNCISGNLLNVVTDVFYQRKKRVVLNGQYSFWAALKHEFRKVLY